MSFTQFTVGGLSPLSPSTKTDAKGTQWVTLESRGDWSIHPEAISSTQPQLRADEWDIDECKPKILDWTEFADWYDRSYHWRGWIPEKALGNSIIPLPNKKMAPYDPAKGAIAVITFLPKVSIDAAHRFNELRSSLKRLLPDLTTYDIPIPKEVDLAALKIPCSSYPQLLSTLCRFCYGMADLLGFFRWCACVFDREIDSQNASRFISNSFEWLGKNFTGKGIGYLVHLDAHYREFGFTLCLQEGIPFYYPWLRHYDTVLRFDRFNPRTLKVSLPEGPRESPLGLSDFRPYDKFLQAVEGRNNTPVELMGRPKRTPFVVDFEGWIRRSVRKEEKLRQLTRKFYWEDCPISEGTGCARIFFLWRRREEEEEDGSENSDRFLPRGADYRPLEVEILRERHKFACAPSLGEEVDPILHKRRQENVPSPCIRLPENILESKLSSLGPEERRRPSKITHSGPASRDQESLKGARATETLPLQKPVVETNRPDHALDNLFEEPAISSRNYTNAPITTQPPDDDSISLVADDELNALELEGWPNREPASYQIPGINSEGGQEDRAKTLIQPDLGSTVTRPARHLSTPSAPKAMKERLSATRAPLAQRITAESSLAARIEVDAEGAEPEVHRPPMRENLSRRKPSLLSRVGNPEAESSDKVASLADHLSRSDLRESPTSEAASGSRTGKFTKAPLPSLPPRRPARLSAQSRPSDPDSSRPLSWKDKGKGKETPTLPAPSIDISDDSQIATSMEWDASPSDRWYAETPEPSTGGLPPPNLNANSLGGWEGVTSAWREGPLSAKSSTSVGGGSEETSESLGSKRPRPLSPEGERTRSRKRPAAESSETLGLALSRIKENYLLCSIPLTRISNETFHLHPHLSTTSQQRSTWNPQYLRWAQVRFADQRSEAKFLLWALYSDLSPGDLLLRAFERHLPISIPIRSDHAFLFKKDTYSEMEKRAFYYTPGFITATIPYNSDGRQLWNNYLAAVMDLLARPHARALIFRGGLVSRLVKAIAPKDYFDGVLYGPSSQVTQHNKGATDPDAGTVDDEISAYDVEVILGVTTTPPGRSESGTCSIWPFGRMFEEEFRGWDGEWNQACEEWFKDSWQWREGHAKVRTGREWKRSLNRDHVPNTPKDIPKVASNVWSEAVEVLRKEMSSSWTLNHLSGLQPRKWGHTSSTTLGQSSRGQ